MEPQFKIGQNVWWAHRAAQEKLYMCPDCFGQKFLTVILGDQSQVTIDCAGCSKGYEPPRGVICQWEHIPDARRTTIHRVEIRQDKVEYGVDDNYGVAESEIFASREEAMVRAEQLSEAWNREQSEQIGRKARHSHSWAWNVTYYRKAIREAQKNIELYTLKLDAAKKS